jgi:hypothetical protein
MKKIDKDDYRDDFKNLRAIIIIPETRISWSNERFY